MHRAVAARIREREELIATARDYADRICRRMPVLAVVVAGSVARGDFNVWSDIDVVVVAEDLPPRIPDRAGVLTADTPPRVQPVGFTPTELVEARRKGNPLVREALESGVVLVGADFLNEQPGEALGEGGAEAP